MGYGAAMTIVLFVLIIAVTMFQMKVLPKDSQH
jgi:ABC-type sugar transport system permease subunit